MASGYILALTLLVRLCLAHPIDDQQVVERPVMSGAPCTSGPLGMQSGAIPDSSITASASYHSSNGPSKARLGYSGWWASPNGQPEGQWIQVDLGQYTAITGLRMEGLESSATVYSIRTFAVKYSNTAQSGDWQSLADSEGETIQLNGNVLSGDLVNVTFPTVVMARFLRLVPLSWGHDSYYCLRFELLGCRVSDGMIRLVNGNDQWSGQVEIYRHDAWGAVCDSNWDMMDAATVCHQLGFIAAQEATTGSSFGESERPIIMHRVACTGAESHLANCSFVCTGSPECDSSHVAGVVCKPRPDVVRLVGGSDRRSGRVEIYRDGIWGTICDRKWNATDAAVVCRQLGFAGAEEAKSGAHFGQGEGPVLMDGVACDGSESHILDCPSFCWEEISCSHSQDAGVICRDKNIASIGESDVA